jgi:hypothetical protein
MCKISFMVQCFVFVLVIEGNIACIGFPSWCIVVLGNAFVLEV